MKTTFSFILLALLASCGSQTEETKTQDPADAPKAESKTVLGANCYQYANQGDTITLNLLQVKENVTTGTLTYRFKEKDNNTGTLQGSMKGDLFVGNYTFVSEGTLSSRQVAFKKVGNAFVEGYGESIDENGTMKFKNIDSLNFGSSLKLQEIPCQK